jgi:D-threonine aldolase
MSSQWYRITNESEIDSPSLLIFKERVLNNIKTLIDSIDDVSRLRPHIKTHKSSNVTRMMLEHGITKFKCATIAEAEMLASSGAKDIVLAYQPLGPKQRRWLELIKRFPHVKFACLIDNVETATQLAELSRSHTEKVFVYIDLNVGMNRTGIVPADALALAEWIISLRPLRLLGLHAYDGHIRDEDIQARKQRCDASFEEVLHLKDAISSATNLDVIIIAGGTPTYSIHSKRKEIECSPGTFIYWDKGYEKILAEQHYQHAAVVLTRVISKPTKGVICVDLGHKSIASENSLQQRVTFLNGADLEPIGHSEEHMVLRTDNWQKYKIGDVLYGVPYHVCPTIALYERSAVVENHRVDEWWITESRNRTITV